MEIDTTIDTDLTSEAQYMHRTYGIAYPPFSYATVRDYLNTIDTVKGLKKVVDILAGKKFTLIFAKEDAGIQHMDGDAFEIGREVHFSIGGVTQETMLFFLEAEPGTMLFLLSTCVLIRLL